MKSRKILKFIAVPAVVIALCAALALSACDPPIKMEIKAQDVPKLGTDETCESETGEDENAADEDDYTEDGYTESGDDEKSDEADAADKPDEPDDEDITYEVDHEVWEADEGGGVMTDEYSSLYEPVTDSMGETTYYELIYVDPDADALVISGVNGLPVIVPDNLTEDGASFSSLEIGEGVLEIGDYAFSGCTALESVNFGSGDFEARLSIGNYAFEGCTSLTELEFAENVDSIGDYAFSGCSSLTSVNFGKTGDEGNGVTYAEGMKSLASKAKTASIGDYAFSGCKAIESVTFGGENYAAELTIGDHSFSECTAITELDFTSNVESIGTYAFLKCSKIKTVVVEEGVEEIGKGAFGECYAMTSLTLPYAGAHADARYGEAECVLGHIFQTTTNYGNTPSNAYKAKQVFTDSTVTKNNYYDIYFPSKLASVTITGGDAVDRFFYDCSMLTEINLPDSVTYIGEKAFYYCSGLTTLDIPDGVTEIGDDAFTHCSSLTEIYIPEGVTELGYETFYYCESLEKVEGMENVTSLGSYVFSNCTSLKEIAFVKPIEKIDTRAFYACYSWTGDGLVFSDSVTSIPSSAFYNCYSLKSITLPDKLKSIESSAFYNCYSLTDIKLPDTLESIGSSAFYQCYGLTSITVPENVTSIGGSAFKNCYKLVEVYDLAGLGITAGSTANGYVADYALVVHTSPDEDSRLTMTDDGYMFYIDGDDENGDHYFMGYIGSDTDLVLPKTDFTYEIYEYAFYNCHTITSLVISEGVTVIEEDAFYGCDALESIVLPTSLTTVKYNGFSGCTSLKTVYYAGTKDDWNKILISILGNSALTGATIYYYSDSEVADGSHWYYDDGEIVVWSRKETD
ncbi:MAG: leucine-rich repeat domain-containing protein [Clostridia bacterium]|nr:leucine-rich repeat domain-containing protein [Clostridia bacterium]